MLEIEIARARPAASPLLRGIMALTHRAKLVIIGSGPAGYTAAIYAARAGLNPIQVLGLEIGGQLTITTDVENYPGFADTIQGPWLMEQMRAQAGHVGTKLVEDMIVKADLSRRPFLLTGDSGDLYQADAVIITTGAQARWLGIKGEDTFKGFGVSACATCDGFFFRDKDVAVIGGGNTAVEEALYLTHHARKVTLVHRRDSLRAEKILQERLFRNPKVMPLWNHQAIEIVGTGSPPGLSGVRLRQVESGAEQTLAVDGLFVAIGHTPNTALFRAQIETDQDGYIKTVPGSTRTSMPGVFAAGDVQDKIFRQAVTAAGTGCMAALEAEKYLAALETERAAAE
jgi:thioredoxin reductase (NADPH)